MYFVPKNNWIQNRWSLFVCVIVPSPMGWRTGKQAAGRTLAFFIRSFVRQLTDVSWVPPDGRIKCEFGGNVRTKEGKGRDISRYHMYMDGRERSDERRKLF